MAICERKLKDSLCVESSAALFQAADSCDTKSLQEFVLQFICDDFGRVSKTSAFEEF